MELAFKCQMLFMDIIPVKPFFKKLLKGLAIKWVLNYIRLKQSITT